jgi:dipeptidyl aminopeptidase/acylaminoacyl peptidase
MPKPTRKTTPAFMFLILVVIIYFLFFYVFSNTATTKLPSNKNNPVVNSPTPFPFQELTIPYLRSRTFNSQLTKPQRISQNSSYSSYLTSYKSDGFTINALLTKPNSKQPANGFPAIVFVHGYIPPQEYRTTEKYEDYVDYLAKSDFVVLKIDLRGHGKSEGEPSGAYYSGDYVIDTLSAYNALTNSNFVNSTAIGLWGHSMAGNVILRAVAVNSSIPAAVIWAGAVYTYEDFQEFGIQDYSYQPPSPNSKRRERREKLFSRYGNFSKDNPFWQSVIPTNYLSSYQGAISINHSINDEVVDIRFSTNLKKILENQNIKHELNIYPEGGHNIDEPAFSNAMQNTVSFFQKHLL